MLLTVGQLKKMLKDVDDDAMFGIMFPARKNVIEFLAPKRGLILDVEGIKTFCVNNLGTHWNVQWEINNEASMHGWVDVKTGEVFYNKDVE